MIIIKTSISSNHLKNTNGALSMNFAKEHEISKKHIHINSPCMQTFFYDDLEEETHLFLLLDNGHQEIKIFKNALIAFPCKFHFLLLLLKIKPTAFVTSRWKLMKEVYLSGLVGYFWVNNGRFDEMMIMRLLVNWSSWLTKFH